MSAIRRERAAGVRSTRQRAAIVEALRAAARFQSAQELHRDLVGAGHAVGLATVYRNLQALVDAGEIDAVHTASGETMFRLCDANDHHHHLVCRSCRRTVEVHGDEVETWAMRVARRHGFKHATHTVEIFGVCRDCGGR